MYTDCSHDIGRWLHHKRRPLYSGRREREVAILNRWSGYITERKPGTTRAAAAGDELARSFAALAHQWRRETAHLSSVAAKTLHPAYLRIIGLGPAVIPLVLARLENEPAYWFAALRSLTGHDPVRPEDAGRFRAMRDSWLAWGRAQRLI